MIPAASNVNTSCEFAALSGLSFNSILLFMEHYSIIVTHITNPRSRRTLAHRLAQQPQVSIGEANRMLDSLPLVLMRNLTKPQVMVMVGEMRKLGVEVAIQKQPDAAPPMAAPPAPVPPSLSPPQVEQNAQAPQDAPALLPPAADEREQASPKAAPLKHSIEPLASVVAAPRPARGEKPVGPLLQSPPRRVLPLWKRALPFVLVLAMVTMVLVIGLVGSREKFTAKKSGPLSTRSTPKAHAAQRSGREQQRKGISQARQRQAVQYCDSASAEPQLTEAIKFYLLALSFNRFNAQAWYGLINGYEDAGMPKQASEARRQMRELLGEESLTVADIVTSFGTLEEIEVGSSGVYRLAYRSRGSGRQELMEESYRLARALRSVCACEQLSLFAQSERNRGLLVHVGIKPFPRSFADYTSAARTTFLE
jgi:hypothetical protein